MEDEKDDVAGGENGDAVSNDMEEAFVSTESLLCRAAMFQQK